MFYKQEGIKNFKDTKQIPIIISITSSSSMAILPKSIEKEVKETIQLIDNATLRDKISRAGINTAKKYSERKAADSFLKLAQKWCRN